ncbi:transposase (plasmid) [Streptomyces sp. AHU1]|uniref:transposase n=1 Tax=Streptomyces sp. AHU1 TaxID=3377215 RepID=UPI003877F56E
MLGVDEFAFRKGRIYGTLLVDVEAGRVMDVMPDRTLETSLPGCASNPAPRSSAATEPRPHPRNQGSRL